jgi:hypothetical protein
MKSIMESLGEKSARNAMAQIVTVILVLGLWAANVHFAQRPIPAVPGVPAEHVALGEPQVPNNTRPR